MHTNCLFITQNLSVSIGPFIYLLNVQVSMFRVRERSLILDTMPGVTEKLQKNFLKSFRFFFEKCCFLPKENKVIFGQLDLFLKLGGNGLQT